MGKLTKPYYAIIFGLCYYFSVEIGLYFVANEVAYFWPAGGIACGFFIFSHKRLWPWYAVLFIPAYSYPLWQHGGYGVPVMAALSLANLAQAVIAGFLVQRYLNTPIDVNRVVLQTRFILLAAIIPPLLASLIGVPTFYLAFGQLPWTDYWLFWMIGNCAGILPTVVFFSVTTSLQEEFARLRQRHHLISFIVYFMVFIVITYWITSFDKHALFLGHTVPYLIFPLILYSSVRFGTRLTSVVLLAYAGIAAYFAAQGQGPYVDNSLPVVYNAIAFDVFIIILTLTCLLLAAIQYELELTRRQLQREKEEAVMLNEIKTRFIANVNHEIRTPVTGVVGASNLLRDTPLNSDQHRLLDVVDESSEHLLSLINDVLDFSRLESNKTVLEQQVLDMESLTHSVIKSCIFQAEDKNLPIYVDCEPGLPTYIGDQTALKQIISNLLANAIKFTANGHVLVGLQLNGGLLQIRVEDTGIGIAASEVGHIFDDFVQEDASMNRRFGGTGLGLAICKKLVQLMGGKISLASEKGQGSTFTVELPLSPAGELVAMAPALDIDVAIFCRDLFHGHLLQKILANGFRSSAVHHWQDEAELQRELQSQPDDTRLLLDWDGGSEEELKTLLQQAVSADRQLLVLLPWSMPRPDAPTKVHFLYRPVSASELLASLALKHREQTRPVNASASTHTATHALNVLLAEDNPVNASIAQAMLEQKGCTVVHAENGREALEKIKHRDFDIVLMDLQMPVMDGFAACQKLKARYPQLPVVAFTANYTEQLQAEYSQAGMDAVLHKPFQRGDLDRLLEQFFPVPVTSS